MVAAMLTELTMRKSSLSSVDTVYFGGGTPSVLNADDLTAFFATIRQSYDLRADAEITLEANPDDINEDNLSLWASLGINRLSIGCQTFNDDILHALNRIHRAQDSLDAFKLARQKGFHNISIDLMFGLPQQTEQHWINDLNTAISLAPEHISAYGLTIEEKTVFGKLAQRNQLVVPGEEQQAKYFERMMDSLSQSGYEQYEISNFCLPGYASKHNSSYWNQDNYLGIGPSAHSFDGTHRMWNDANNMSYIKKIQAGQTAYTLEKLSDKDRINEYILTALRTKKGVDRSKLIHELNYPEDKLLEIIEWLSQNGWIDQAEGQIFLTTSGKLLADEITLKIFLN